MNAGGRGRAMDGHAFAEWIMSQPGPYQLKARALGVAHKLGYSPRISTRSPARVEGVRERMARRRDRGDGPEARRG